MCLVGSGMSRATIVVLIVLAAVMLWLPVSTGLGFRGHNDEFNHHIPNVLKYVDRFPTLEEMRNTRMAMLPLFHGVFGQLAGYTGTSVPALRLWMVAIGIIAMVLFGAIARRTPGADWRLCVLLLAAFPYFGVSYMTVLTDFPAFLALTIALFAQIRYLDTGRERSLWLAGIAGVVGCLIRQNLIIVPAVFGILVVVRELRGARRPSEALRGIGIRSLIALALPLLATGFQLWLWGGVLPPRIKVLPGYFEPDFRLYLHALFSIVSNVGYYLLPATLAWAIWQRRRIGRAAWGLSCAIAAGGAVWMHWARGGRLTTTGGVFNRGLALVERHAGRPVALLVIALSILSFVCVVASCAGRIRGSSGGERWSRVFLLTLLGATSAVFAFGLFDVYERHLLPVYAVALLCLLGGEEWSRVRVLRFGWVGSVAFGVAHSVGYAVVAYGLLPMSAAAGDFLI